MRKSILLIFLLFIGSNLHAEVAVAPVQPACSGTINNVQGYRCVCRINFVSADGRSNVSIPVALANGQTTIFSTAQLTGPCTGTIMSNSCNPAALNGANAQGTYSCIAITTTDTGVTFN